MRIKLINCRFKTLMVHTKRVSVYHAATYSRNTRKEMDKLQAQLKCRSPEENFKLLPHQFHAGISVSVGFNIKALYGVPNFGEILDTIFRI